MGYGSMGYGLGWFWHAIVTIVGGLLGFFLFLIAVGLLFLLVRFLLAGTRAAHIYIAKNSPPAPARPTAAAPTTVTAAKPAAAKPAATTATKPRTPKPPAA